jgi:hypothetical protein
MPFCARWVMHPTWCPPHSPGVTNTTFKTGDVALSQHDGAAALRPLL